MYCGPAIPLAIRPSGTARPTLGLPLRRCTARGEALRAGITAPSWAEPIAAPTQHPRPQWQCQQGL